MNKISQGVGYIMMSASCVGAIGGTYNGYQMAQNNKCKHMETLSPLEKCGEYMCCSMITITGTMLGATLTPLALAVTPMYGACKLYDYVRTPENER